jgi:hypothetical protein
MGPKSKRAVARKASSDADRASALDEMLAAVAARRQRIQDEVARCDIRVFQMETRYLDAVCYGRPGYVGSLLDGWGAESQVRPPTPASPVPGGGSSASQPPATAAPAAIGYPPSLRVFSLSSATALASVDNAGLL